MHAHVETINRRMNLKRRAWMATMALGASPALWAQFRVDVSGVGMQQIPIALAPFKEEARSPQAVSTIVRADLERSGAFRVLGGPSSPTGWDETSPLPQEALRAVGADAWLAGSMSRLADRSWDLRYRLWDVVKGQAHYTRSASVPAADLRLGPIYDVPAGLICRAGHPLLSRYPGQVPFATIDVFELPLRKIKKRALPFHTGFPHMH